MRYNPFSYTLFAKKDFAYRETIGFFGGMKRNDGEYILGSRKEQKPCVDCDDTITIPTEFPATYLFKGIDLVGTGEFYTDEDGHNKEFLTLEYVEEMRPLTNTHPHYNQAQILFIRTLPEWTPIIEGDI